MMTSSNGNIFRVTGPLRGEFPGPGEFAAQRPVTRSFDVFFDLRLINDWVNKRHAGDLRRHCGHYDVNVMCRQEGPVTLTWRKFHKEYPQPSETKIILNITYLIFIQVCRGSMSKLNIHIESGNYRLWNGAFLRRVNIQWNWPMLSCHHCSSHLIMTQQVVSPVSYDTCMAGQ